MKKTLTAAAVIAAGLLATQAFAASHGAMAVMGEDQDVSGGTVTASQIMAAANGWLVGGMKTGVFEYTLGAKEDGPVRVDGKLVMTVITAK
mgnify:CR=1 FL=1